MENNTIDPFSKLDIIKGLEEHDAIFKTLASMGRICFSEKLSTAWVSFDLEGNYLNFYFNPKFWEKLSLKDKIFIISHECLHVLLKHGLRLKEVEDHETGNHAADLVVNHLLIDKFLIDLEDQVLKSKLCLIENIDPKNNFLKPKQRLTLEEYYSILVKNKTKIKSTLPIDSHQSGMGSKEETDEKNKNAESEQSDEKPAEEMTNKEIDDLMENLSEFVGKGKIDKFVEKIEKDMESSFNTYGPNPFTYHSTIFNHKTKQNFKWRNFFLKVAKDAITIEEKEYLQWIKKSRRNSLLPSHLIFPHSVEYEEEKRDKLRIQLYIDFSGSCRDFQKDFWDAYDSIPKKEFDVDLFTVTDYILPVVNKKLQGSYGNAPFQIIEENIQNMLKESKIKKYPNCVVVITDGHADPALPEFPQKWLWVLPRANSTTHGISKLSKIIYLDEIK